MFPARGWVFICELLIVIGRILVGTAANINIHHHPSHIPYIFTGIPLPTHTHTHTHTHWQAHNSTTKMLASFWIERGRHHTHTQLHNTHINHSKQTPLTLHSYVRNFFLHFFHKWAMVTHRHTYTATVGQICPRSRKWDLAHRAELSHR